MIMYFQNSRGDKREIGRGTESECIQIMQDFLDDHNFKSYYTRVWISPENPCFKKYDVGSHTEFFLCYNPNGWREV